MKELINYKLLEEMNILEFSQHIFTLFENNFNSSGRSMSNDKLLINILKNRTSFIDNLYIQSNRKDEVTISIRLYCLFNNILTAANYPTCEICGNIRSFNSLSIGFKLTCGKRSCFQKHPETNRKRQITAIENYGDLKSAYYDTASKTILEKYGVENVSQSEEVKEKKIKTSLKKYGTEYPWQTDEIKEKRKDQCLDKYGVENISQLEEVKEKKKETTNNHFGVNNPFQSEKIKLKTIQTMVEKYGVENSSQSEELKEKKKETCLINYGVENPGLSKELNNKSKMTCLEHFGVEYPFQSEEIQERMKQTCLEKYGVENPAQSEEVKDKIKETVNNNFFNKLLTSDRLKEKCIPNFTINEFDGVFYYKKYSWICTKCENIFEDHLHSNIPRCPICYPILNTGTSKGEKEVNEFVKSLGIETISPTSKIIPPKELDIFISSHNLAIEFDGLYWHSELDGHKNKTYHINKTQKCKDKGIQLLHIFEDEWIDKQEIVKSVIKAKLGKIENRIYARKCQIKEVPNDDAKLFLFDNHLQGPINGAHLGLYYADELVSILTYGKSRFNKTYEYELLRFCNKINITVVGGLSKLLKHANLKSVITYADLRYGTGQGYLNCGFKFNSQSNPSYYYLKNNQKFNRLHFQKHLLEEKLDVFDSNLTEWENMQLNGYDRIWDCGNLVFTWEK